MAQTSLVVKLLVATVFAATLTAAPEPVNNTELIPAGATITIPEVTPPVAVKKPIVRKAAVHGDCTKYQELFDQYDWSTTTAMQICRDESHGYPETINWNDTHKDSKGNVICVSSRGLMQVACFWPKALGYTMDDLLDPAKNIAMAYEIYKKNGFSPWTTYDP